MKRHIWLRDLDHLPVPLDGVFAKYNFTAEEVSATRAKLARRGLRLDNFTGHIRDDEEVLESFGCYVTGTDAMMENPGKWVPYTSEEDIMRWDFRRQILSDVARERRNKKRYDPHETHL